MSTSKSVSRTLYATTVDMGGFPIRQPIPTQQIEQIDPFLLLHHHRGKVNPDTNHKTAGIGPHPHRGFSPVTFVYEGAMHHRDSRGNSQVVEAGGVQWMNAGMGIIHSERPGKDFAKSGGTQEIIQLWINSAAKDKMNQPYYLAVAKDDMPTVAPEQGTADLRLVCGDQQGKKGPVSSPDPMLAIMGSMERGSLHQFDIPIGLNSMIYVLDGTARISGHGLIDKHHLVELSLVGDTIKVEAKESLKLLVLAGSPIKEALETYGPFVMNNQTQVMQAMRDYQMGKMGVLIEEFED